MERDESFYAVKSTMEPSIPCVGSDDEDSFVVLGTSSLNEEGLEDSLNEEILPPIRTNKIHDMQNLIKMEISQINSSTVLPEMPSADTLKDVTSSVANITLSPESSYEEIQKQVEELIKENEKLKNIIAQSNLSMKAQYDRILTWKDEVNNVMKSYKVKFVEAKNYIDKCKEENCKLANDVEKYKKIKELQDEEILNLKRKEKERENAEVIYTSAEQNMIEFDLQAAKKKIDELQTELAESNLKRAELVTENETLTRKLVTIPNVEQQLEGKNKDIKCLRSELEESHEQIIKLKNEIDKLRECLELEIQKSKLTQSTQEQELERQNDAFKREIASLKGQLNSVQVYETTLEEKRAQLSEQLMNSQKTITALEEDINGKVKEIDELRQLLQNNSRNDEIFALKEQLNVYKNDFEAERESRNALKQERDQIAEDLQNLQKRNKQLQNEVETLRSKIEPPKPEGYTCPKCAFGFGNYQSLENHVHRCLDLDGFP